MKVGLDTPKIETLYLTCHSVSHNAMRLKGDTTVNSALDNALQRESEWTHKKSTAVASEAVFNYAMNLQCPQSEVSSLPAETGSKERVKLVLEPESVRCSWSRVLILEPWAGMCS